MHRSNNDGEAGNAEPDTGLSCSGRRLKTEISNRRTDPPLLSGSTAGDLTSGSPAPFVELGVAVSAVVMRVRNSRLRIRVAKTVGEEDDGLRR